MTGLGLAMVYGFVKNSDGHVAIYSEPLRDTIVRIYLPRQLAGVQGEDTPPADEHLLRGQGELILLVEDDAMVRDYARGQLNALGYRLLEARNGHEGLALLKQHADIALLFTDVV